MLLNDEDLAYAKIRLDARSLQTAIAHLGKISDPLARSLVWGAAWDQTRDAEASASDYVDLVLRNIGSETESTTVRTTLGQLQLAANSYVAPEKRAATREKVADALWALAEAAEAGSDSQLQFVTAFASAASTPAQWDQVRRVRDGEVTFADLEIDTDLSWQLLVSLAAGGVVTASDIDDALAADNTAKGGEFAAQAKAALPTLEARRAAWSSLIDSDDLPNTIVRSSAAGFTNPAGVVAPRRVRPAVLRHAAADLELPQLPDRAVPDRRPVPGSARERAAARRDPRVARRERRRARGPPPTRQRERRGRGARARGPGARRAVAVTTGRLGPRIAAKASVVRIEPTMNHRPPPPHPRPPPGRGSGRLAMLVSIGYNVLAVAGIIIGAFILAGSSGSSSGAS